MRLYSECIACQVRVRFREITKLFPDEKQRMEALKAVIRVISDKITSNTLNPVRLATELFRLLKSLSRVSDPYAKEKAEANRLALSIYPSIRSHIVSLNSIEKRVLEALRFSLIGNLIDFGVADYAPPSISELLSIAKTLYVHGDLEIAAKALLKARRVVVLMDNCGEAVFDRVLADALKHPDKEVIAIVKGGTFQNDITIHEARDAGLYESFNEVISTGTDAASIFLDEVSTEILRVIERSDIIVSKGMANYEYLTDIEHILRKTVLYLLIAKCEPIAIDTQTTKGTALAILRYYPT